MIDRIKINVWDKSKKWDLITCTKTIIENKISARSDESIGKSSRVQSEPHPKNEFMILLIIIRNVKNKHLSNIVY